MTKGLCDFDKKDRTRVSRLVLTQGKATHRLILCARTL